MRCPPPSPVLPYTTLFRSCPACGMYWTCCRRMKTGACSSSSCPISLWRGPSLRLRARLDRTSLNRRRSSSFGRSEEHTSELQSHSDLVCRLLLEKKKTYQARAAGDGRRMQKFVAHRDALQGQDARLHSQRQNQLHHALMPTPCDTCDSCCYDST